MQHVAHRASDARAHPELSRPILVKIGQQLRSYFEREEVHAMPERMEDAVRRLHAVMPGGGTSV